MFTKWSPMAPASGPLTQPNWRAYPSASATDTSLKRSVLSRTIFRSAPWAGVNCSGCAAVPCACPSCASAPPGQTLIKTRVIIECWHCVASRPIFMVEASFGDFGLLALARPCAWLCFFFGSSSLLDSALCGVSLLSIALSLRRNARSVPDLTEPPPKPAPDALESLASPGAKRRRQDRPCSAYGAGYRYEMSLRSSETFLRKFFGWVFG